MNQITSKTGYAAAQNGPAQLQPHMGPANKGPSDMASDTPGTERSVPEARTIDPLLTGGLTRSDAKPEAQAASVVAPDRGALSEADARMLQRTLLTGNAALVRRSDLTEMHTRVVKLFETLNQGVGQMYVAKAEKDRGALSARIDGLEEAVNRMEGALRIELEPVLRTAISDVIAQQMPPKSTRGRTVWTVLGIVAAVTAGAIFHEPLAAIVSDMETQVSAIVAKIS